MSKAQVKAILKYQKRKNKLIKKHTGIELIPKEMRLSKKTVKENIYMFKKYFSSDTNLTIINCLHCSIYYHEYDRNDNCTDCPYVECKRTSIWGQANIKWQNNANADTQAELNNLGRVLEIELNKD